MTIRFIIFVLIFFDVKAFSQTIPWASQEAEFIFPIYFENGDGQKDTIYIANQSGANISQWYSIDSIYGERPLSMDTSLFNVYFKFGFDSTKANVYWPPNYSDFIPVSANNVIYPVKISWDTTRFSFYHSLYQPRYLTNSVLQDGFNDVDMTSFVSHELPLVFVGGGQVYNWFPLSVYFTDGETYHPDLIGFSDLAILKYSVRINSTEVKFRLHDSMQLCHIEIYDMFGKCLINANLSKINDGYEQFYIGKNNFIIIKLYTENELFVKKIYLHE